MVHAHLMAASKDKKPVLVDALQLEPVSPLLQHQVEQTQSFIASPKDSSPKNGKIFNHLFTLISFK